MRKLLVITIATTVMVLQLSCGEALGLQPGKCGAIAPYLEGCRKCGITRVYESSNKLNRGRKLISENVRCSGCVVQFRMDLLCVPSVQPCPGP